ncbi:hypothetical protein B4113_1739 [Geobacillus sp. B4113_201601]|nr:hypothetical protein B4113_1739 [Geobacillus sp. B4113_201601]
MLQSILLYDKLLQKGGLFSICFKKRPAAPERPLRDGKPRHYGA